MSTYIPYACKRGTPPLAHGVRAIGIRGDGVEVAVASAGAYEIAYTTSDHGGPSTLKVALDENTIRFVRLPKGAVVTGLRPM